MPGSSPDRARDRRAADNVSGSAFLLSSPIAVRSIVCVREFQVRQVPARRLHSLSALGGQFDPFTTAMTYVLAPAIK